MAFGENQLAELEPVTQSRGAAAVKRSIAVFEKGLIISYAVGIRGETPVTVTVTDNLPANWEVGQLGFHPDHEPDSGDAGQSTIRFTVDVTPDEFRMLKVGVRPAPDKPPEAIESDQSFSQPQIERADPIEAEQGGSESTLIDGPSDDESAIEDPSALSSNGGQSAPQSPASSDSAIATSNGAEDSQDDEGILPSDDPIADVGSPSPSGTDADVDPNQADSVTDLFGGFSGENDQGNGSVQTTGSGSIGGTTTASRSADGQSASVSPTEETIGSPIQDEPTVGGASHSPTDESSSVDRPTQSDDLLPRLLDELGDLAPDQRDQLAAHLSDIVGPQLEQSDESTTVRIQQLESQIEEFAAYTDALGELLDQDEPAALLDDVQAELDSLRQEVGALQQDVKEVHDRQDTVEVRIESIISDLEHVIGTRKSTQ